MSQSGGQSKFFLTLKKGYGYIVDNRLFLWVFNQIVSFLRQKNMAAIVTTGLPEQIAEILAREPGLQRSPRKMLKPFTT
ncbi:MAG: hypothetical protein B5M56_09270 [Desulfococcus sp. 4484_241]|nr:MAG: hypothetical protein B5M56_09270 [Desulfococcus sp. 4484_241]